MREVDLVSSCATISRRKKSEPAHSPVPEAAGKVKPAYTMSHGRTIVKARIKLLMISSKRFDATKLARMKINITKTMINKRIMFNKMIAT